MSAFVSRRFLSTTARRLSTKTEEKAAADASNGPALVRFYPAHEGGRFEEMGEESEGDKKLIWSWGI
ncbi:hypothetical protein IMZ48_42565 [Candidatus Bathyarchaeota archaeon]|nr:hypothetical protein [Candidatus Bathyarchaeota archaeon]